MAGAADIFISSAFAFGKCGALHLGLFTYLLPVCVQQKVGNLCGRAVDLHKCGALHLGPFTYLLPVCVWQVAEL